MSYRSRKEAESFLVAGGSVAGPSAREWNAAATEHSDLGLAALNDTGRAPSDRLGAYREHLRAAERLLVRSLASEPEQPRTLAQLARLRWELDPPKDDAAATRLLGMIGAASRMAPGVPRVQMQIGELLLEMGRRDDAAPYLRRAVDLDPGSAAEVVDRLRESLYSSEDVLDALPRTSEVLVALEPAFALEEKLPAYLEAIEPAIAKPTAALLSAYATACLDAREPRRLLERFGALGRLPDPQLEAERLLQTSRAHAALADPRAALADARRAAALLPEDARMLEHLGQSALAAGEPEDALLAFRRSLATLARTAAGPRPRARLYGEIGQAEERGGRSGPAYDAYRIAVELDPEETFAKDRMARMRKAAGLPPPR